MRGWFKIDDGMPEHPKIAALEPVTAWTFVCSIAYASRNLTDGFVPDTVAFRLADHQGHGEPRQVMEELVDASLWTTVPGGYIVHDYLDYQRSKADVIELEEARRTAGRKGGKASSRAKSKQVLDPLLAVGFKQTPSKTQAEQELEQEQEKNKNKNSQPNESVAVARRDVVWDFVVELSGEPLPGRRAGHGRVTSDLRTLLERNLNGAPPDAYAAELRRRHEALVSEFGEAKATARSLVNHWERAGKMADGLMRPPQQTVAVRGADRLMAHAVQLRREELDDCR